MQTELSPSGCARQFSIAARFFGGFDYERRGKYAVPALRFCGAREAVFSKDGIAYGPHGADVWRRAQAECSALGYALQKERELCLFLPQCDASGVKRDSRLCLPLCGDCGLPNETPLLLPEPLAPYAAYGVIKNGSICALAACNTPGGKNGFWQIGVYTAPKQRRHGYGAACVFALCAAILQAGEVPVFRTERENTAAIRTAAAAGLIFVGTEHASVYRREDG